jgi:pimeloyl-ACP methyl ester carboxylesterase
MKITVRDAPPRSVWALQQAGVHPLLAQLFAARGVLSADELDDGLARLLPPSALHGAADAAVLLADTMAAGRKICIVADYDCDGATACAVGLRGLKLLGARLIKGIMPGLKIGNELKPDQLSRDPAWQEETKNDPLYLHNTTPRWFFEAQGAQKRLSGLGSKVTLPLLMVTGTADPIASMPAARAFFETIGSRDKTFKEYGDYRHEVMMEIGKEQVWADISQWISSHC